MDLKEDSYSFWEQIELNLKHKIRPHIKNTFHICGYSNPLSWLEFCNEDIDSVEKYVKQELPGFLQKKFMSIVGTEGSDSVYKSVKSVFFGGFEFDVTSFQFHIAERRQLYQIKSIVKDRITNEKLCFDTGKGQKISSTNTVNLLIGVFFGNTGVKNYKVSAELELDQYSYSFWQQIESDFKQKIRPHIKNALHICGYSNSLSWLEFCEKDVESVEKYIQQKLLGFLEKKCENVDEKFDSVYKPFFFGAFEFDTASFRFQMGEKRQMTQIKLFVTEKVSNEATYFNTKNNHIISSENTIQIPFGFFFGENTSATKSFHQSREEKNITQSDIKSTKKLGIRNAEPLQSSEERIISHPDIKGTKKLDIQVNAEPLQSSEEKTITQPDIKSTKKLDIQFNAEPLESSEEKLIAQSDIKSTKKLNVMDDLVRRYTLLIYPLKKRPDYSEPNLEDVVSSVQTGSSIRAFVACVFCKNKANNLKKNKKKTAKKLEKGNAVQGVMSKKSSMVYWNFSNYKKHLRLAHNIDTSLLKATEKESSTEIEISQSVEGKESCNDKNVPLPSHKESFDNSVSHSLTHKDSSIDINTFQLVVNSSEDRLREKIFNQISAQMLKTTTAVLMNREVTDQFNFRINDQIFNVQIAKIKSDGSCLFGTLTHQLHGMEIDSEEHQKSTDNLRLQVIDFIRNNLKDFEMTLKGVLIHSWEGKSPEKLAQYNNFGPEIWEKEINEFLSFQMPLKNYWGGAETMKAVGELYKVNVVTAIENSDFFFSIHKMEYTRLLLLAYRRSPFGILNHYDSITGMENEVMYACADALSKTSSDDYDSDCCFLDDDD